MDRRPGSFRDALISLLSGSLAGLVADAAVHPVDTIRARLQVQRVGNEVYRSTLHTFRTILRHESWQALYKGFGIVAAFTVPAHALYFSGYELSKAYLFPSKKSEEKGPLVHFISGLIADVFGSLIWVPMDVVKQRLQVQRAGTEIKYRSSAHALLRIYREEGFLALYRGFGPAISAYGPFVGIYFTVYEQNRRISQKILGIADQRDLPLWSNGASGFVASAVAAAITCPIDVIKTRIQVESKSAAGAYKSGFDALRRILREEGIRALGKGLSARILWMAPNSAITIAAYEQFKKHLGDVL